MGRWRDVLFGVAVVLAAAFRLPGVAVAAPGILRVAVNPIYPPLEFRDPLTDRLTGFDIDLGEAIGARLHRRVEWQETSFPQMIPALVSGRDDMILSGFSDLPSRHGALEFVRYLRSGAQVLVLGGDPVAAPEGLCGRFVAASRATAFPGMIRAWSHQQCVSRGLPEMRVYPSESGADARIQLLQGRVAAMVQGSETVGYFIALTHGAFRTLGAPLSESWLAMAFTPAHHALSDEVRGALDGLVADGTYARLVHRWSLEQSALPEGGSEP